MDLHINPAVLEPLKEAHSGDRPGPSYQGDAFKCERFSGKLQKYNHCLLLIPSDSFWLLLKQGTPPPPNRVFFTMCLYCS